MLHSRPKTSKADNNETDPAPSERRRAQRFRVHWGVTVRGIDGKGRIFDEAGYLENLSSTGALMVLPRSPAPDARLSVRITIPLKKRDYIGYSARVARVGETGRRTTVALVFETKRPTFASSFGNGRLV
ncbi:MAG TPA: PilZ domain-containing protein [Blastocatellia bacterium]|nr:PilZ domain-containing protein [Blastocatellia bacterium]